MQKKTIEAGREAAVFEVRAIRADATRSLRHEVLWPHRERMEDCVIDIDGRADAIHLGAFDASDRLVGVCSLFAMRTEKLHDDCQYRLRAMATSPAVRGQGAGKAIVLEALRLVAEMGYDVLWCDARKVALGFYAALGFDRIDAWYEVPLIGPHQLMYYRFVEGA